MENQVSQDSDRLNPEGLDKDFIIKSMLAFNNIQLLLNEAIEKKNIPVIVSNIERLNSMVKYYLKNAELLNSRISYYQDVNRSLEIENERLIKEQFLLIAETKGREPYKRAKELVDQFFEVK